MDNNTRPDSVSYFDHEVQIARAEAHTKRWTIAFFVAFAVLVISNLGWIYYENQFEDNLTVTQETPGGNNNYIGRDGDITNGSTNNY